MPFLKRVVVYKVKLNAQQHFEPHGILESSLSSGTRVAIEMRATGGERISHEAVTDSAGLFPEYVAIELSSAR